MLAARHQALPGGAPADRPAHHGGVSPAAVRAHLSGHHPPDRKRHLLGAEEVTSSRSLPWRPGSCRCPERSSVLWVLFVNLVAATIYRFVYKVKRIGILIIHGGLFVLLFGMFFTQYFAQESFLSLLEGEGGNVTTDYFDWEVAVWDPAGETRRVTAVDARELAAGNTVGIARYDVELRPAALLRQRAGVQPRRRRPFAVDQRFRHRESGGGAGVARSAGQLSRRAVDRVAPRRQC